MDKAEAELAKNEREVKKLKDEIMRALLGESTFSQTVLSDMLKAKEAEAAALAQRYEDAQNRIMELDQELSFKKTICEEFADWTARFDIAPTADKKAMLLNIIDRIDVHSDSIDINFKLELNPLDRSFLNERIIAIDPNNPDDGGNGTETAPVCAVKRYEYARTTRNS